MSTTTYIALMSSWILGSIFSHFVLGIRLEIEIGVAIGGIVAFTFCYLSKQEKGETMKATFIGENNLKGFKNGKEYEIISSITAAVKNKPSSGIQGYIVIFDKNSFIWGAYESVEVLLKNWKFN